MLFLTGDTHGDFTRFRPDIFPEQKQMTKQDYVIVLGDFGGVWDGSKEEQNWLDWLEAKPFTTLFVSGNHENYDLLASYPIQSWKGGRVQVIRPSVFHLMRGEVFTLLGKTFFTLGGASSHDISAGILEPDAPDFRRRKKMLDLQGALYRVNHRSWWKEELPSQEEYRHAQETLNAHHHQVDYILTHCAPTSIQTALSRGMYQPDPLTDFLEQVKESCQFQYWSFGHYHENKVIPKKYVLLYEQILELTP